jgi:signal transduction histidine kinase
VLYVLGVLVLSAAWGLGLGLATSVASALALWIFHTSPTAGFHGVEAQDLFAIFVLLITEVVAAVLADRARQRAHEAEGRLALETELRRRDVERVRLREIQASRARVLAAGDEERKRVVRDLHDGAQQRLVHTAVTLKLLRRSTERGEEEDARVLLDDAISHATAAIEELRELAHGILPAVIARGGVRAGVEALADRTGLPVAVDVDETRLPSVIEATAYFVVAEALTNVVKHAGATRAVVRGRVVDGAVEVEIVDDGVGGATADGPGLTGICDRLAVLGGTLTVDSPPGGGTTLRVRIPLAVAVEG